MEGDAESLDLSASWTEPMGCTACEISLTPVTEGDRVNFLCVSCQRCWSLDLGVASRVDPVTCVACPHQPACLVAAQRGWSS